MHHNLPDLGGGDPYQNATSPAMVMDGGWQKVNFLNKKEGQDGPRRFTV